jgi:hypothetical protein
LVWRYPKSWLGWSDSGSQVHVWKVQSGIMSMDTLVLYVSIDFITIAVSPYRDTVFLLRSQTLTYHTGYVFAYAADGG